MNACLAKTPPRHDIINEYSTHYHKTYLTDVFTVYWDDNHKNFEVISFKKLKINNNNNINYKANLIP